MLGFSREAAQTRREVYEGPDGAITVMGNSNIADACPLALAPLFINQQECSATKVTPHSFNCVYQPAFVTESKNFLVFENFFYTSSALSVASAATTKIEKENSTTSPFPLLTSPKNFLTAATTICNTEWSTAQAEYPKDNQPKDTTLKLCFSSSYAATFLTKGLHLTEDKLVTVQKEVDGSEIEWALGECILFHSTNGIKYNHIRKNLDL